MVKVDSEILHEIDGEATLMMREIADLGKIQAKADKTKDATDYKKWSDAYDVMEKKVLQLVGRARGLTTEEELEQVAGGTSIPGVVIRPLPHIFNE